MRLGENPYMDVDRRNDLLLLISQERAKEARIAEVIASIPAWADRPFKDDQDKFNVNLKAYQAANPLILKLEARLTNEPGPIWKELTAEEKQALSNWTVAIDSLSGYVDNYFPTRTQKYVPQIALWAIAIGAFVAPLFLSDEKLSLPFHFGPPGLPPGMGPSRRAMTAIPSQRPSYPGASFSKIPFSPRLPATPVQAEVMRPAVQTPPWRASALTAPGSPAAAAAYRSFTKPLGPTMPVTSETAQAVATAAAPPSSPHGSRIYPRFRK
jgi:hypothetical protein